MTVEASMFYPHYYLKKYTDLEAAFGSDIDNPSVLAPG